MLLANSPSRLLTEKYELVMKADLKSNRIPINMSSPPKRVRNKPGSTSPTKNGESTAVGVATMAKNCNLQKNPLHKDQLEIIKMIGGAYAVNCVIDEERNLSYINFGEIVKSHIEAVDFMMSYAKVKSNDLFDTIITSSAGAPLDATFYQTVKGMVSPLSILKKGGDLIIFSECKEGMGSDDFLRSQTRLLKNGKQKFITDILKKKYADVDEWQTEKEIEALNKANIYLYSKGISKKEEKLAAIKLTNDPISTIEKSIKKHNNNNIAIIPEGPYVVPTLN